MNLRARAANLSSGLTSGDPGLIRLQQAARGAVAIVSAGLVMHGIVSVTSEQQMPVVTLFAAVACFCSLLMVVDGRPADRRLSLLLGITPFCAGVAAAALLADEPRASAVTLLALMFLAYYLRRFGMRAGELGMMGLLAAYVGGSLSVSRDRLGWFELASLVGILSAWAWQFLLWPYRPQRDLERAIAAFQRRTVALIGLATRYLDGGEGLDWSKQLQQGLDDVGASRRVIEQQFVAVASLARWTQQRLGELRLQLYDIEEGLRLLVQGIEELAPQATTLPLDLRAALSRALRLLEDVVSGRATSAQVGRLADEMQVLQTQARAVEAGRAAPWEAPLLRTGAGGLGVAQASERLRALVPAAGTPAAQPHLPSTAAREHTRPPVSPPAVSVPVLGRFR